MKVLVWWLVVMALPGWSIASISRRRPPTNGSRARCPPWRRPTATRSVSPAATLPGTYLYGLTFAFGWTAYVGPILGAILTTLVTTGLSILSGALLVFIYAPGLATPLTLIATFFCRLRRGTHVGNVLRGRGFSLQVAGRTLHLHTTSIISGAMLVVVGFLLATGQLTWLGNVWPAG